MEKLKFRDKLKEYIIIITLLIIMVIFSLLSDKFLSPANLINVVRQVSMLGIVAVGVSFVMIGGGMDLSVGAVMSIACTSVAYMMVNLGWDPVVSVILSLAFATGLGLVNGAIGIGLNVHPLIVTLGTMTLVRGVSYAICGGLPINGLPDSFSVLGQGYLGPIPIPVIIFVAVIIVGGFLLNKTVFGRTVFALGGSEEVTRLSGVSVKKLKLQIYMISGLLAGLAGVIGCSRVNGGVPTTGSGYEFDVLTAAILGGVSIVGGEGKMLGVIFGVFIIGVLSNGMGLLGVGDYYQSIIKGAVLLLAVAFDVLQQRPKRKKNEIKVTKANTVSGC